MSIRLIKKVTFACPECNTAITFNVPDKINEFGDLRSAAFKLKCPML